MSKTSLVLHTSRPRIPNADPVGISLVLRTNTTAPKAQYHSDSVGISLQRTALPGAGVVGRLHRTNPQTVNIKPLRSPSTPTPSAYHSCSARIPLRQRRNITPTPSEYHCNAPRCPGQGSWDGSTAQTHKPSTSNLSAPPQRRPRRHITRAPHEYHCAKGAISLRLRRNITATHRVARGRGRGTAPPCKTTYRQPPRLRIPTFAAVPQLHLCHAQHHMPKVTSFSCS